MGITLTKDTQTLELPDSLHWVDEFAWSPVVQTQSYTLTGALVLEHATKQAGRPITLESTEERAWCSRAMLKTLREWAASANAQMTLLLRGTSRNVTFNHEAGALGGVPVLIYDDASVQDEDFYLPTLRLLEI